jgi:hypothetical protein
MLAVRALGDNSEQLFSFQQCNRVRNVMKSWKAQLFSSAELQKAIDGL